MAATNRVLIVEDEPLIAMMLEDFLDVLGRAVAGVADCCAAALQVIEAGSVDAAIIDVNLRGGERSWPVAAALTRLAIPFVIATGGTDDPIADEYRECPRLMKPYTMDGVAKALDALGATA